MPIYRLVLWDRALTFLLALSALGFYLASTPAHLVADLSGGMLAALLPFYLFPDARHANAKRTPGNPARGIFYLMPAILSSAVAFVFWPWSACLLWPAACYTLVSWAYFTGRPSIFHKSAGRIDWASALLLGPHLWASSTSLPYLRSRVEPWAQAVPGLFFGRLLTDREPLPPHTEAVLDLTAELDESERLRQFEYLNIPLLDQTVPTRDQLEQAIQFIDTHLPRGAVYVHCAFGYSRSAGVVAAYLLSKRLAPSAMHAVKYLTLRRAQVALSKTWVQLLEDYRLSLPPATASEPTAALEPRPSEDLTTSGSPQQS